MKQLLDYLQDQSSNMAELLARIVSIESPTHDKAAVNRVGDVIAEQLRALGGEVIRDAQTRTGDHVIGTFNRGGGSPISMFCHMDTVHPVGSLTLMPVHIRDGKLWGPGAFDMKASHVIALFAIRALQEAGMMPTRELRLVFTSDEETGSHTSRALIEDLARGCSLAMVMEPAMPDGKLKSSRKGVGRFKVAAKGRAAHAGADHAKGINAIEELAHQTLKIQALTDYARGVTFNVGTIRGGDTSNVVPDHAVLEVDTRCERMSDAEWITQQMLALTPALSGATLEVEGEQNRPPMEFNAERQAIFERVKAIGAQLGLALDHAASGGGSDASFTAGIGVPTMDGFGAVGDGLHAKHEHVVLASLPERAALSAAVIAGW